jgi:hypothetical protein
MALPSRLVRQDFLISIMSNPRDTFGHALQRACDSSFVSSTRYAVNHVQLDGKQGRIVATDGRQVLVQSGFKFPWDEQVLIPRRTAFGCKELPSSEAVLIGNSYAN